MANIGIDMGKGFYMTFANGWTVSVQFGPNNYCNNRTFEYASLADMRNVALGQNSNTKAMTTERHDEEAMTSHDDELTEAELDALEFSGERLEVRLVDDVDEPLDGSLLPKLIAAARKGIEAEKALAVLLEQDRSNWSEEAWRVAETHAAPTQTIGQADMRNAGEQGCDNAEVAAMKDGTWYRKKEWTDNVKGWLTPDEIAAFIAEVAALPEYLEPAELAGDYSDELTE